MIRAGRQRTRFNAGELSYQELRRRRNGGGGDMDGYAIKINFVTDDDRVYLCKVPGGHDAVYIDARERVKHKLFEIHSCSDFVSGWLADYYARITRLFCPDRITKKTKPWWEQIKGDHIDELGYADDPYVVLFPDEGTAENFGINRYGQSSVFESDLLDPVVRLPSRKFASLFLSKCPCGLSPNYEPCTFCPHFFDTHNTLDWEYSGKWLDDQKVLTDIRLQQRKATILWNLLVAEGKAPLWWEV